MGKKVTHSNIDILDWKLLIVGMIKSGVKMKQPSGRVITAKGGVIFLVSVYLGQLCSTVLFVITPKM